MPPFEYSEYSSFYRAQLSEFSESFLITSKFEKITDLW